MHGETVKFTVCPFRLRVMLHNPRNSEQMFTVSISQLLFSMCYLTTLSVAKITLYSIGDE